MPEDVENQGGATPEPKKPDPSEVLAKEIQDIKLSNQALLAQLQALTPKKEEPPPPKKIGDLFYEDAEAGAKALEDRIEQKLEKKIQKQARDAAQIQSVQAEYPELHDPSSELYKKAAQIFNSYSPDEQTAIAFKASVREAAADLDLKPKSKRKSDSTDDWVGGSSGGSGQRGGSKSQKTDDKMIAFASLMGFDTSDPKVVERLTSRAKSRKNWASFE